MRTDLLAGNPRHGPYRRERSRRTCPVDWSAVEPDYRSGSLSLRDMALKHGCSHSAIANFAGKHGWKRDGGQGK
jgi:hypothetical protein